MADYLDPELPIVIYIASASRSGSTVLDLTLGSLPGVVSVGEMRRLNHFSSKSKVVERSLEQDNSLDCTCGHPISECDFWQKVEKSTGLSFSDESFSSQAGIFLRLSVQAVFFLTGECGVRLLSIIIPSFARELGVATKCLTVYRAISKTNPDTRIIIDSSKLIYHFILLKTMAPHNVKLIHLIRDGRAVAKSMMKGQRMRTKSKSEETTFARALKIWWRSNFTMLLLSVRIPKTDRCRLKYEDFCRDYSGIIKRVLAILAPSLEYTKFVFSLKKYHNIGGSPSRFHFKPGELKLDETWRQTMSEKDRTVFSSSVRRFNRYLGYND